MQIHLKFYGEIADIMKTSEQTISINSKKYTITQLKNKLFSSSEKLQSMEVKIAINNNLSEQTSELENNDEVSFLPPFAGG